MAVIRATCDDCGDLELAVEDVLVRVCEHNGAASYLFRCTQCRTAVARDLDGRTVDLLVGAGASVEVWRMPAELTEPRPDAGPITTDDLIDAHRLLSDDDRTAEMIAWIAAEHGSS